MAYSAAAVANAFIEKANKGELSELTPMKLQKLLFYTQSWHLKLCNDRPLFDDLFARWKFGPVIPPLYHMLKKYGSGEIQEPISIIIDSNGEWKRITPTIQKDDADAMKLIDKIIEVYGGYSGTALSNMTHAPGSAWSRGAVDGGPITHTDMAEHIH
ncbi:SocA family protein [Salmonella enterica]|nr:SocA family protein [Salmonella enterica]